MNVIVIDVEMNHKCMAAEIKFCSHIFICVAVHLPVFSNTNEYEEKVMFCLVFIYEIASHYTGNNNFIFTVISDFNFDLTGLANVEKLTFMHRIFSDLAKLLVMNMMLTVLVILMKV